MNVTVSKLMDTNFDTDYKQSVINWDTENTTIMSLTFTLNPILNNADILTQYRSMIKEIKYSNIFYYKDKTGYERVHPHFIKLFLVPELTKQLNIHFHGILIVEKGSETYFINEMRRLCWKNSILGRQHACKIVDNNPQSKDAIAGYALKDLSEMNKVIDKDKIYKYKFESNIEK